MRHASFTVIWLTTVISNIGSWMYSTASGWLMTELTPDPLVISLVQVATTLPMVLLALPAGALTDVFDRRRLLIVVESATTAIALIFAVTVWFHLVTPTSVLLFTFVIGVCNVLTAPGWQAIVPQLVPKQDLPPAITLNGVGFNISRAVGPALGGAIIGPLGIGAPFWINAISNLGSVGALIWWRSPRNGDAHLPAERVWSAMVIGARYGRYNSHLRATMTRAVGFFFFASAYWALLPLVARDALSGGPTLYGVLLAAIGLGAVLAALVLPWLKQRLGPDRLVASGTLGTAASLVAFGLARNSAMAVLASLIAGISWIAVLASLNVSAQVALPEWVRGRGLALYMVAMFGAMTAGSAVWGKAASLFGLPAAHVVAAAGAVIFIPLTWRWRLQTGAGLDLAPSRHWPTPIVARDIEHDRGPILVTVEYLIDPKNRGTFLALLERLGRERCRDGAYAWGAFEDSGVDGRIVETFFVESWVEHLRQHERVTNADRDLQGAITRFHQGGEPKVSHFIAARPGDAARGLGESQFEGCA